MIPWNVDEGLGTARNSFSTKLAWIKNLRRRMERPLGEEIKTAEEAIDASRREAEEMARQGLSWVGFQPGMDFVRFFEQHRERTIDELQTGREMLFEYLMGALDSFFGAWWLERNLEMSKDGRWPACTPQNIRVACEGIHAEFGLLPLSQQTLTELRERRHVLLHRGGIADQRYREATGQTSHEGTRLEVSEQYLDDALEFIDRLVAGLAIMVHDGARVHELDQINHLRIVSMVFERKTLTTPC